MNWLEKPAAIWRAVVTFLRSVRAWFATTGWWMKLESWQYDPPAIKFTQWLKMGGVVVLVLIGVFMTGRLTARSNVAVLGFALPAADYSAPMCAAPVVQGAADGVDLRDFAALQANYYAQTQIAGQWRVRALETEDALRKRANLPKTVSGCKPQVKYVKVCPKQSTVLEDLGLQ